MEFRHKVRFKFNSFFQNIKTGTKVFNKSKKQFNNKFTLLTRVIYY